MRVYAPKAQGSLAQGVTTGRTFDTTQASNPLHVLIAGAGVGGLALANQLQLSDAHVTYTVLEKTNEFRKFGGPIQLASNAMESLKSLDAELYAEIEARATWTGNRTNGIKDGIRNEWYAKFDLESPAKSRGMPYTCVVERPELQELYSISNPNPNPNPNCRSYSNGTSLTNEPKAYVYLR